MTETMDEFPSREAAEAWGFRFHSYGFALIKNNTSHKLKTYSYDAADAVAWIGEEMLEIVVDEAKGVLARVDRNNNAYVNIYKLFCRIPHTRILACNL